jgi:hypothetical protein
MTIGRKQITQRIESDAKWIDLPPCVLFQSGAISAKAVSVASYLISPPVLPLIDELFAKPWQA